MIFKCVGPSWPLAAAIPSLCPSRQGASSLFRTLQCPSREILQFRSYRPRCPSLAQEQNQVGAESYLLPIGAKVRQSLKLPISFIVMLHFWMFLLRVAIDCSYAFTFWRVPITSRSSSIACWMCASFSFEICINILMILVGILVACAVHAQLDKISALLASLSSAGDPTLLSRSELARYQGQVRELDEAAINTAARILSTQAINSKNVILQSESLEIQTIKASLDMLDNLLYSPPTPISGQTSENGLKFSPQQLFDIVVQHYHLNVYRFFMEFPYPEQQKAQVVKTDIPNFLNISLNRPFQYLLDTGLRFDGDPYADANVARLEEFMEQTRYLTCIVGRIEQQQTYWKPECQQQTLIHPNGKVLIECNCFNISSPIVLVNDTRYIYQKAPNIVRTYVIVYRSAVLWIVIIMTIIWMLFTLTGYFKDKVHSKRRGRSPSRPKMGAHKAKSGTSKFQGSGAAKSVALRDPDQIDTKDNVGAEVMEADVLQMKQESKNNSLVIKFDEEGGSKKKRKKKVKYKTSFNSGRAGGVDQSKEHDQSAEPINTVMDTKREVLTKGAKSENFQDQMIDQVEEDGDLEGDEEEEDDDEEDDDEREGEGEGEGDRSQAEQQSHQVSKDESRGSREQGKDEHSQKQEEGKLEENQGDDEEIKIEIKLKIPDGPNQLNRGRSQSNFKAQTTQKEKEQEKEKEKSDKKDKNEKKVEKGIPQIVDPRPLPPITMEIFLHLFLRQHELFSIFYYFKAKESRTSRFVVNHSKNMLVFALCGFFAVMLPLGYNIIIMFAGLLVCNGIEQIATILLKQTRCIFTIFGIIVLLFMNTLTVYLFVAGFTELEPEPHEIWLWTFVTIYLTELILIEIILIGSKIYIQPWLRRNNQDTSPLFLPLFAIFWDRKVQRIIRRQHRLKQNIQALEQIKT